ncbi:hypothetical protein [Poriferisphaera sp. WC338]|uniref:hypothetical protein n=1 Tax=Poriferisphaera sp. WC338 TaxID=3425129 RepID=UPI003D81C190
MNQISEAFGGEADLIMGVRCIRCGYDLRGINEKGTCPECGFGNELSHSLFRKIGDLVWGRKICRGAGMIAWGLIVSVLAILCMLGIDVFARREWGYEIVAMVVEMMFVIFALPAICLMMVGIWFFCSYSEWAKAMSPWIVSTWLLRCCAMYVAGYVLVSGYCFIDRHFMHTGVAESMMLTVGSSLLPVCVLVMAVGLLVIVRRLNPRFGMYGHSRRRTMFVSAVIIIWGTAILWLPILAWVFQGQSEYLDSLVTFLIGGIFIIVLFAIFVFVIDALFQIRRALRVVLQVKKCCELE